MLLRCGVVRSMLGNEGRAWSPPESPSPRAWLWDLSKILEPLQLAKFCYFLPSFPRWLSGQRICLQCRRHRRRRFDPWVGKTP